MIQQAPSWGWQQRGQHPVVNVSRHEAVAYAQWLSHTTRQAWRLPTEVEWEWAARAQHPSRPGGQAGPYWWGKESPETKRSPGGKPVANCRDCGPDVGTGTTPVAHFAPNPFGLYDTVGNVWEWTHFLRANDNRPQPSAVEPKSDGDANGWRVLRGGAWFNLTDGAHASYRLYNPPDDRNYLVGFRVCRASPIETPGTGAAEH